MKIARSVTAPAERLIQEETVEEDELGRLVRGAPPATPVALVR